jgi:hypothetical protein
LFSTCFSYETAAAVKRQAKKQSTPVLDTNMIFSSQDQEKKLKLMKMLNVKRRWKIMTMSMP